MIVSSRRNVRNDIIEITDSKHPQVKIGDKFFVKTMYFNTREDESPSSIDLVRMDEGNSDVGKNLRIRNNGSVKYKVIGSYDLQQMNVCSFTGVVIDEL